ncbi:RNA polymerase subunit sigma-24 [Candidatus Entotheonella serta]|nr:RNA polymerase subunit sigma-24 [Candidatus Entotheonella serta]
MLSNDGQVNWQEVMKRLNQWVHHRVHDPADADELVQDILERLLVNRTSLVGAENPVGWVHRVATNAIIDYYRRLKKPVRLDDPVYPEASEGRQDARAELSDCLRPLVLHLDSHTQEALLSTDLGGNSQVHAAQDAGVPLSTMKARIQRGRRKLRDALLQCCHVVLDRHNGVIDFAPRVTISTGQKTIQNHRFKIRPGRHEGALVH